MEVLGLWEAMGGRVRMETHPAAQILKLGPAGAQIWQPHGQLEALPGLPPNVKAKDPLYEPLLGRNPHHPEPIVGLWESAGWRN